MTARCWKRITWAVSILHIVSALTFVVVVLFAGPYLSELIGAYWPELGKQIAEFIR